MIKGFEPRLYQQTIFATAAQSNTLVVLPTGMGKTNIFLMLAAHRLKQYPGSKILLLGPTRPLIDQYYKVFVEHFDLPESKLAIFTGNVAPKKRRELWEQATVVFSTPQGLENDLISNRISLEEVSLLGVDEAHRAVGDYAYVFIAGQYNKRARHPRIIAMTASPGSDMARITEVAKNLGIEDVEVRTEKDADVRPYIQDVDLAWVKVKLPPPFLAAKKLLDDFLKSRIAKLRQWGVLHKSLYLSKTDLLKMQAQLRGRLAQGEKDPVMWQAISVLAEIMKVQHGLELLESQGVKAAEAYLERLERDGHSAKSKAVRNIVADPLFRSALLKVRRLSEEGIEHPKLIELQRLVEGAKAEQRDVKMMVFNQFRDSAKDIVDTLNTVEGIQAKLFIGQTKKGETGMSQKEQKAMLDEFRAGGFNVLVATSVGEEGLDIPRVDHVVFYEPIPSAIRHIQRKGRTGRGEKGKVTILMAEGTRDVAYRWSAHHKQRGMHSALGKMKATLKATLGAKQRTVEQFAEDAEKVTVIVDHREKGGAVVKQLIDLGCAVRLEQLGEADYLLSARVAVEYKTVPDFVQSILDGRLLDQIRELRSRFERPLVVIEGSDDLYSVRNVHPNAIRGMLSVITVSYGVPLLQTRGPEETAGLLHVIAKREQEASNKDFLPHAEKRVADTKWLQEYIVASLPGIGSTLNKPLLREFKTIRNIVNASVDDLQKVEKIGKKKAEEIRRILDEAYGG